MLYIQSIRKRNIKWIWSSVVCDQTISTLYQLIRFGHCLNVKTFCFCNLTIEPNVTLKHVSQLEKEEAKQALSILDQIEGYCLQHNLELDIKAGLINTLKETIYGKILNNTTNRSYPLMLRPMG